MGAYRDGLDRLNWRESGTPTLGEIAEKRLNASRKKYKVEIEQEDGSVFLFGAEFLDETAARWAAEQIEKFNNYPPRRVRVIAG